MKTVKFSPSTRVRCGLGLLLLLSGCTNAPHWGAWSTRPTEAQIAAALQQPVPRVQYLAATGTPPR